MATAPATRDTELETTKPPAIVTQQPTPAPAAAEAPTPTRPLRLIQITDPHLFAAADGRLLGLDTRRSFAAVLALALHGESAADALVMTGDLVHDETRAGYIYLAQALAATGIRCFCIPGNHDRRDLMQETLGDAAMGPIADHRLGGWHLIFLDSTRPGVDGGRLVPRQIEHLDALLQAGRGPAAVFLHQHPLPVGSAWLDTMDLTNGAQLLAVCDRHPHLKALVCGHIHQEFTCVRGHYRILGTPSTCLQFLPGSADFALDSRTPGYRELRLYADGRLDTWVVRLAEYPEPPILSATGY